MSTPFEDPGNPYASPQTISHRRATPASLPGFCLAVFILDLVFCCLRLPIVVLGIIGYPILQREQDPLLPTALPEIVAGGLLAGSGILADIGLLMRKGWGLPLGYLSAVAVLLSAGVAMWQLEIMVGRAPANSPEFIGILVGGGFTFLVRLALLVLYVAALMRFSAWQRNSGSAGTVL